MSQIISKQIVICFEPNSQSRLQIKDQEKQILDQLLDKNKYDTRIVPVGVDANGTQGPVVVNTNIYIRSIEYICTKKNEWKVQITFRQKWNDQRLKYDDRVGKIKYLSLEDKEDIWIPDTFFSNARESEAQADIKPNTLIRIYPNGNVLFSIRLVETLACPMDLKHYPFDTQTCAIQMASYGFTTEDLVFEWKEEDPVQVTRQLALHEFSLDSYQTNYCTSKTNTGEYSCIKAEFQFSRHSSKYGCQWFLPTAVLTFIAFVSFWLKPDKCSRIRLLVVTLLLLYLHVLYINAKSSSTVSYHTAKDCWTSTCLLFVLAAFLEYGIVRLVHKYTKHSAKSCLDSSECKNGKTVNNCEEGDAVALKPLVDEGQEKGEKGEEAKEYTVNEVVNRRNYVQKWRQSSLASQIDYLSAILFPFLFVIYIIVFFSYQTFKD
ncbi:unnamed protein product [Oppiella nova]|uniref:Glutamate-gated chloride channel n=1 Tax=Oppiella nova TaxID=334625 RepID=A0A7R9L9H8_9ACAR|nr:unnamed protein product [Oppiella nova]CAG2160809.1 unnamed protein product [Oppiella nova]